MHSNLYAVIMAGGIGSRFWPVSTTEYPKQFHDLLGSGQSLLQKTFSRLQRGIPDRNIWILTNERYNDLVLEQLPEINRNQIIPEPAMRNTAPCILLSALKIYKQDPEAIMLVAPSDHWIEDEHAFHNDIEACYRACMTEDKLLTLGITPDFPNTGYGYIECDPSDISGINKVRQFTEKPDYAKAKQFLADGNFLWNSGIFIWSARSIIAAYKEYLPRMYHLFQNGLPDFNTSQETDFIRANYSDSENISIDYGILEKANNVYVKKASFDWNDLGTWGALHDKLEKDNAENAVVNARPYLQDSKGNMIFSESDKLIVVEGIDDYIIVDKENVLLIFPLAKEQDIKNLLSNISNNFGEKYT